MYNKMKTGALAFVCAALVLCAGCSAAGEFVFRRSHTVSHRSPHGHGRAHRHIRPGAESRRRKVRQQRYLLRHA